MTGSDSKFIVRRYYDDVLNRRMVDALDQLATDDYQEHDPFPGQGDGRADLKARVRLLLTAFDPYRFTIEDIVAEGGRVAVRWTASGTQSGEFAGIPPTGKQFTIAGIDVHAVRDGRMAEHWHVVDQLALLQQLGLVPKPSQPAGMS